MGHLKFITSITLFTLFAIAIISFSISFANDNNTTVNINSDADFPNAKNNASSKVDIFYDDVNTTSESYAQSTISSQTEASEGGTQFKVGISNILSISKTLMNLGFKKIFGSGGAFAILFTALIGLLGYIAFAYAYKAWVGRNPD